MTNMNELTIEKNNILAYLTDKVDGLGYEQRTIHQATKDLFIRSDIMKQVQSPTNLISFKSVLKEHFNNDHDAFYKGLIFALNVKLNSRSCLNVAFLLNEQFLFKGKYFTLFNKKNLLSKENCTFNENTFVVIVEYTHKLTDRNGEIMKGTGFRPDFIFFVNGIYFSYLELKFLTNGQNAKDSGTEQIIEKFFNSYQQFESQLEINKEEFSGLTKTVKESTVRDFKKEFLRIFTSPIHISSFDSHELYIARNFDEMEQRLKSIKKSERAYEQIAFFNKSKQDFKLAKNTGSWKESISSLFSQKMIEREVLYYNMNEKPQTLIKRKFGKKESVNKQQSGYLVSPRPPQKYAVDRTADIIDEILTNESNPEYWINKTKQKIKHLPQAVQADILEKQAKFKNNKYSDSILLAYAAGFGKTNIIGWLAMLMKDIVISENQKMNYAYDTIFLITDRLELKEQINQKMRQMNVEKGLVVEVKNSKDFKAVMTGNARIVIINIQKFTNIKKLFNDSEVGNLQDTRNVFIIDEIHRSNAGSQHDDMMSLFSQMFNGTDNTKKNLLIGLTATASEDTLLRFGECASCDGEGNIIYMPHDSYTMLESIEDGFTLPFHNSMTPISISMTAFEKNKTIGTNTDLKSREKISKADIYENPERCDFVSKIIVGQLFNNVYRKIYSGVGGKYQGKAMLACYSIQTALLHHKYIKQHIAEVCNKVIDNPKSTKADRTLYEYYKDTGVYIVYSNSENKYLPKASTLNDGENEKTVINNFKNTRNGIMIVVDKLQTGFDEKKIHTLFLNTEKKGISLIQLLSRANRTLKGKNECHIVDFSHNNVNYRTNLPEAWNQFAGEIYSNTDIKTPAQRLEEDYVILTQDSVYYKPLKNSYLAAIKNPEDESNSEIIIEIEKRICSLIRDNEEHSEELKNTIFSYFKGLQLLDNIIDIDPKYKECDLELFYKKLLNMFNNCKEGFAGTTTEIGFVFESGGSIIDEFIPPEPPKEGDGGGSSDDSKSNLIELFNQKEELKLAKIEEFEKWMVSFIDFVKTKSKEEEKVDLIGKIKNNESNDNLLSILMKLINKATRYPKFKGDIPPAFFDLLKERGQQYVLDLVKSEVENSN